MLQVWTDTVKDAKNLGKRQNDNLQENLSGDSSSSNFAMKTTNKIEDLPGLPLQILLNNKNIPDVVVEVIENKGNNQQDLDCKKSKINNKKRNRTLSSVKRNAIEKKTVDVVDTNDASSCSINSNVSV
jgi:hypothetical protein